MSDTEPFLPLHTTAEHHAVIVEALDLAIATYEAAIARAADDHPTVGPAHYKRGKLQQTHRRLTAAAHCVKAWDPELYAELVNAILATRTRPPQAA